MTPPDTTPTTTAVTPGQVHRLVYAGLLPKERIAAAFAAVDPRRDVEVWRGFARATLLPLGVALVVIALGLGLGARHGNVHEVSSLTFVAAAFAAALVGLVNAGKRARLPGALALLVGGALVAGNVLELRALRREDDLVVWLALLGAAAAAWVVARTRRPPGPLAVEGDLAVRVADFVAPASTARKVAAGALWVVGAPVAFACFVAFMEERDLGVPQLGVGLVLLVGGAVVTRLKRPLFVARHAALLAFLAGTLFVAGALVEHIDVDRDARPFLVLPVLIAGWLAVRSWPVRALWGAVFAVMLLVALEELSLQPGQVERADDVAVVLLAALTTFALTRGAGAGAYVRPVAAAGALALLVLAAIEIPWVGRDVGLALGTATSLGVMACLVAGALRVLRDASRPARALACVVLFCAGALFIDAPGVLLCALVVLLARHARVRGLELAGFVALLVSGWALVDKPWVVLEDRAVAAVVAAVVVLAVGLVLRRLPVDVSAHTT